MFDVNEHACLLFPIQETVVWSLSGSLLCRASIINLRISIVAKIEELEEIPGSQISLSCFETEVKDRD